MSDLVIETKGLRKVYRSGGRRTVAVDTLDLAVARGGVHGFLGPNGSGKTTTIRMLLGLARPSKGTVELLGQALPGALTPVLTKVGAVVEEPCFSPSFSGRKNLRLLARLGSLPTARVPEVLERVGLADRARDRYCTYSLGMKQRLAIAAALLKEPELLILDEPTNGLDPAGIRDIRQLVRELGQSGTTVLLSSHNLAEIQQVCTAVSIIGEGKLLASGAVSDLLGEDVARTRVGVSDSSAAEKYLQEAGYSVTRDGGQLIVEGHDHPEQLARVLAEHDLYVDELSAIRPDLESFFLQLTGHRPGEAGKPSEPREPREPRVQRDPASTEEEK